MTTLVARPTRARHSGAKQQTLALAHQRLMLLMLVFLGVGMVIAGRIVWMNVASDGGRGNAVASLSARGLRFH